MNLKHILHKSLPLLLSVIVVFSTWTLWTPPVQAEGITITSCDGLKDQLNLVVPAAIARVVNCAHLNGSEYLGTINANTIRAIVEFLPTTQPFLPKTCIYSEEYYARADAQGNILDTPYTNCFKYNQEPRASWQQAASSPSAPVHITNIHPLADCPFNGQAQSLYEGTNWTCNSTWTNIEPPTYFRRMYSYGNGPADGGSTRAVQTTIQKWYEFDYSSNMNGGSTPPSSSPSPSPSPSPSVSSSPSPSASSSTSPSPSSSATATVSPSSSPNPIIVGSTCSDTSPAPAAEGSAIPSSDKFAVTYSWLHQMDSEDTLSGGGESSKAPWYISSPGGTLLTGGSTTKSPVYPRFGGNYSLSARQADGTALTVDSTVVANAPIRLFPSLPQYQLPDSATAQTRAAFMNSTIHEMGRFKALSYADSVGPQLDTCQPQYISTLPQRPPYSSFQTTDLDGRMGTTYYYLWHGPVQYQTVATGTSNPQIRVVNGETQVVPTEPGTLTITVSALQTNAALAACQVSKAFAARPPITCADTGRTVFRTLQLPQLSYNFPTINVTADAAVLNQPVTPSLVCQSPVYADTAGSLIEMNSHTAAGNSLLHYEIDYLNGATFLANELVPLASGVKEGISQFTKHSWLKPGSKTVTVRAVNENGVTSSSASCQVEVKEKPVNAATVQLKLNSTSTTLTLANLGEGAIAPTIAATWSKQNAVQNCSARRLNLAQGTTNWDTSQNFANTVASAVISANFAANDLAAPYTTVMHLECTDGLTGVRIADSVALTFSRVAAPGALSTSTRMLLDASNPDNPNGSDSNGGNGGDTSRGVVKGEFCE